MGRPKQLLDVHGQPLLLATVRPLVAAEVAGVLLVTHQQIAEQLGAALPATVILVRNDDAHSAMIDSVRIALRAWSEREPLRDYDGLLVCPADQPGISTADFDTCIRAFRSAPDRIVVASYQGRCGHPLIFPASLASFVQSKACDCGLNALPRAFPPSVLAVPCRSPSVTRDVDIPSDWEQAAGRAADRAPEP
jgi:CTP:molybdopterin cytidylyltransferase MocA